MFYKRKEQIDLNYLLLMKEIMEAILIKINQILYLH